MDATGIPGNSASGISNNGIGQSEKAPLGSGLLLLSLAGAGYAAMRRNRSRKGTALLLACVMLLGFTQCKKEQPAPQAESVRITLTVDDGNKDSRVIVDPTGHHDPDFATVTFEEGDVIYVGNNGKYCGFLTYDGTNFTGTINPTSGDNENTDYLHFYFMGNKTPSNIIESGESAAALAPNSTTSFDVNITDQTAKYPVISY